MSEAPQVTPQDARTFLGGFGHSADSLKTMPDADVVKLHGTVKTHYDSQVGEAVKAASAKAPVFGEKWRETLAGEDQEDMKTLTRFTDPAALWKRTKELNKKLSSGELKAVTAFPDKGTDDEKAAWRKDHGIPDKPEGYDLNLGDGMVIGEADKPLVGEFTKMAHAMHTPPELVKGVLKWYLGDYREAVEERRAEEVATKKQETEAKLKEAWGADYKTNQTIIENLLHSKLAADSPIKARIMASIGMEPEFAQLFASLARDINPVTTLVSGDPAKIEQSINDEIAKIEKVMRDNRKEYNRDEKMQARYRELLDAREKMKERQKVTG